MDKADELSTKELNFKIWKEYQKIEMHFNDLLIKLRVQILGLIIAVITIGGFVLKLTNTGAIDWKIVFWILIVLCFIWIALFLLDYFYYNKLLIGAVYSTIKLEKSIKNNQNINITLSEDIQKIYENKEVYNKHLTLWPIIFFYIIVLAVLVVLAGCVYKITFQS